jgi:TRAP-type C4-dicarboxylate transport system substrate-binding protein
MVPRTIKFIIVTVSILCLSFCFTGCKKEEPLKGELKLIMATYIPVGYPLVYEEGKIFVDLVNKLGKGIVQVEMYWGGTLLKGPELLAGLHAGTADIIFQTAPYMLGSLPILGIQSVPIYSNDLNHSYRALKMGTPLYKLQNEVLKEKNIFQIASAGCIPEYIWTKDKLIRKPEDLKGMKIRVAGKVEAMVVRLLGSVPVILPSAEVPTALQRGVVDGTLTNPWTARGRRVEEYCKYMLIHPVSFVSTPFYALLDKWNTWPEKVRKVILEAAAQWEIELVNLVDRKYNLEKVIIPFYKKGGMGSVILTEEEAKAFAKATRPVVDWWVKKVGPDIGEKAVQYVEEAR